MPQDTLIVSNWKMNLNLIDAKKLIHQISNLALPINKKIKNVICPQFLLIPLISKLIEGTEIILGSQDCHQKINGSFTGDSSIELVKEFGCKFVIIGHSERRKNYNESNNLIREKANLVRKFGLSPIICIGESLYERKKKDFLQVISTQLNECVEPKEEVVIAYEPIWAIGSGLTPTIDEILEIKNFTLSFLKKEKDSKKITFLYGGSVDSKNYFNIVSNTNINGALIGGASIKKDEIKKILTKSYFN